MDGPDRWAVRGIGAGLFCLALIVAVASPVFASPVLPWQTLTGFTYVPQRGTPALIPNFVQPSAGCNWAGVGGQVFDHTGAAVNGLVIHIAGTLDGQPVDRYAVTGSSLQFGPGGYDLALAGHPAASTALTAQVLDVGGALRSSLVAFRVSDSCTANLTVLNLVEIEFDNLTFLPLVTK